MDGTTKLLRLVLGLGLALGPGPAPTSAWAQGPRGPLLPTLPSSARALGMGNVYPVSVPDADALFHNPALVATARGLSVGGQRYGGGATAASFSGAMEMAPGGLALGVRVLDYGAPAPGGSGAAMTADRLHERGPVLASDLVATVGYARPIRGVRIGVAASYLEQRLGNDRSGGGAVDLGVAGTAGYVTYSLAARNVGRALETTGEAMALPHRYEMSVATRTIVAGPLDLIAVVATVADARGGVLPGGGLEAGWWPVVGRTFIARAGARARGDHGGGNLFLGGGFTGDRFSLDYAYEGGGVAGAHRVGIRWR